MDRELIDDRTWERIAPFLLREQGRRGRLALDSRLVLEGVFWIARTGAPWRDLPERFGRWSSSLKQAIR